MAGDAEEISGAEYTRSGDPLKIDCGYSPNGTVKLFHAVTLQSDVNAAKVLAFSFPRSPKESVLPNTSRRSSRPWWKMACLKMMRPSTMRAKRWTQHDIMVASVVQMPEIARKRRRSWELAKKKPRIFAGA